MNLLKKVKHSFSNTAHVTDGKNKNVDESTVQAGEDFFHVLLETVSSPITYAGPDSRYKYVNKICAEWFGLNPSQIIGKPVKDFFGEETYRIVKPYMERAIRGETVR